nr:hypothetical protein [Tanacetum cinerariifolium]
MAFISSAKHNSGNEEVNIASGSTTSINVSTATANIGVASISQDTACAYIASQIKFKDINQIDKDDMEEMDIKWNMALLSMRANRAPKIQDKGRRDNYRQGSKVEEHAPKALMAIDRVGWDWSYVANNEENHALIADEETPREFALMAKNSAESEIDKDDMEEMDIKWNMALLSMRANRAPKIQDKGRRDNYRQGSKVEEHAPKALMAIDRVGWDWSYVANNEENHALIADEETPTEFALMAKNSAESEVFNNSLCFKAWLAQVEARLAELRNQELKYCEKIIVLEFKTKSRANCIESLTKDLELL